MPKPKPKLPANFSPHPCPPLWSEPTPHRGVRPMLLRGRSEPLWSPVIVLRRDHHGEIIRLGLYKTPESALRTRERAVRIILEGMSSETLGELHDACTSDSRVRVEGLVDDRVSVELIREVAGGGERVIATADKHR